LHTSHVLQACGALLLVMLIGNFDAKRLEGRAGGKPAESMIVRRVAVAL